ncbi:NUDIX hydrolase [Tateyamaria sp.]|uniref:NUDIX hydrolase n=1 Tax=Tateyamaria sp. TaxID=1929288 RepID=UPI003B20D148
MTAPIIKQLPLHFGASTKSSVRTQFAALCYRIKGDKVQVLLVTTRRTGRWIIPKGWPMDGMTPQKSAAQEAWEEAGVVGRVDAQPLGLFSYTKQVDDEELLPCVAMVYAVRVKSLSKDFPEAGQRKRKWLSRSKAASLVGEPELARILRDFDPRVLR